MADTERGVDFSLERLVEIPDSLPEKYDLARILGLDIHGISESDIQEVYPETDYPFWNEFIEKERRHRTEEISARLLNEYVQSVCEEGCSKRTRSMMRAAYQHSAEYNSALDQAMRQDPVWCRLAEAVPGDEMLAAGYSKYHADLVSQRTARHNRTLTELLVKHNMTLVKAYVRQHFSRAVLEPVLEEHAQGLIRNLETYLLSQRKLYLPENLRGGEYTFCASGEELDFQYLLEDLPNEEEVFLLSLLYESVGKLSFEEYFLSALFAEVWAVPELARIRQSDAMEEAISKGISPQFLDAIYGSGVLAQISGHFLTENVLELLLKNPYYSRMASECMDAIRVRERSAKNTVERKQKESEAKRRRIQAINAEIMERIPEHYKDLYPAARSMKRRFILHLGPTNSGKTYSALKAYREAESGVYLGPLRLLAYEVYESTNGVGIPCSMITGEEELLVDGAFHYAQTVETMNETAYYQVAVIDEGQMIADRQRGGAWTEAILGLCAEEIHICAAPEAENILTALIEHCADACTVIRHQRFTPLRLEENLFSFPADIQSGDALIVFSRNAVLEYAERLRAMGIPVSMIYGALPYDVRRQEVDRFLRGETKVVVATDCIGMGLNLPVHRVVFLEHEKFDGIRVRTLYTEEIMQIAGRAGRYGMFEEGICAVTDHLSMFRKAFNTPGRQVREARLSFPKRLISVDGKLSDIIDCWNGNQAVVPFIMTDLSREKALCRLLERYTLEKNVIYSLITVPFNEKNEEVSALWERIAVKLCKGEALRWSDYRNELTNFPESDAKAPAGLLRKLEIQYQLCDLLYFCFNRFGEGEERLRRKGELLERKGVLSEMINNTLSQFRKKNKPRKTGKK